jgi:hypothetical protein
MSEIIEAARAMRAETKAALQTVYDALNQGQQKKLLKNETVKALLERYGVEVDNDGDD